jgi:hypothetical protein
MKPATLALTLLLALAGVAGAAPDDGIDPPADAGAGEMVPIPDEPTDPDALGAEEPGSDEPVVEETPRPAPVQKEAPFKELPGRWVGEGRLGMKDGKTEKVQCRATYFVNPAGNELKQNIRCASASGKIEVKSLVNARDGKLSGTWNELVYNLGGDMTGEVTQRGFRIAVRSGDLTANMDVIVLNDRQVVEIQFFSETLRGLTLILKKG